MILRLFGYLFREYPYSTGLRNRNAVSFLWDMSWILKTLMKFILQINDVLLHVLDWNSGHIRNFEERLDATKNVALNFLCVHLPQLQLALYTKMNIMAVLHVILLNYIMNLSWWGNIRVRFTKYVGRKLVQRFYSF